MGSKGKFSSKVDNNISYQPLLLPKRTNCSGADCAKDYDVAKRSSPELPITPLSNLPSDEECPDGMPGKRDFTIYRLKREIATLRRDQKILLGKLSRCLEALQAEERYFSVGLQYDQWETYSELQLHRARISGVIGMIIDVQAEQQLSDQQAKALKERFKI